MTREPYRSVYLSSPDRGLERVLVFWPLIRKHIPEATLHIYYGWENYDRLGGDRRFKEWIQQWAKQDGIEWHGRIGQRDLAVELAKAGSLFYPGPHAFEETFCISALEAQAAGCVPVTRDNGALPEVNRYGLVLSTRYATALDYIAALRRAAEYTDEQRVEMQDWALTQTWAEVATRLRDRVEALVAQTVAA